MFPHLNHPNFRSGLSIEEFAAITNERFFEVYNGHQGVFNDGAPGLASTEELWDAALIARLTAGDPILYGLAVDDAHVFSRMTTAVPNPGRGWVQVRAEQLNAESLIEALEAGDFYGSSGVELEALHAGTDGIRIRIVEEPGEVFVTQFIGARTGDDPPTATVLQQQTGLDPAYAMRGDELYVRARIVSTRRKVNGYRDGEVEMAWTQPVAP